MRRVAVLGGGMAGLAAAWALSDADVRGDVEVTVYQRGWRLGGKGASSRGVHGRIEEHGLHVWLGYYDNAFALLQEVYGQLDRANTDPECPVATWRDAVVPADHVGVGDESRGSWAPWLARFSPNSLIPGEATEGAPPLSAAEFVRRGLRLLGDFASSLDQSRPLPAVVLSGSPQRPRATGRSGLGGMLRQAEAVVAVGFGQAARTLDGIAALAPAGLAPLLTEVLGQIRATIEAHTARDAASRRTAQLMDLVVTCLQGIARDGLLDGRPGFGAIDHLDFREWLAGHGAGKATLDSPLIRGLYDLVFAYEHGDPRRPRFAAGLGLFLAGKLFFDYRGSIFWQLQAGMGDVVIAPLYQALRARGVHFEFFHRVDRLHLDANGTGIAAVTLGRQTRTRNGAAYEPLVRVRGMPCFPEAPLVDQLAAPVAADAEHIWSDRSAEDAIRLVIGAPGADGETNASVDAVVLATSVGMLPHVCGDLIEHSPRFGAMVAGLATVPTQALQLWLRAGEDELGWPQPGSTVSGYVAPFDTYAAMSHVAAYENWPPAERPRGIGYFCSVLATSFAADPSAAHAAVRANAVAFLDRHAGALWPGVVDPDGGFRWSLLCGAASDAGADALDTQYWRANVDPSDQYVQSLPGTGALRLRADGAGFAHLFLAGDWIDCGLNAGCVEAAVMSGIQAANAVLGRPLTTGIRGAWAGIGSR